jgi:hypothetical protein
VALFVLIFCFPRSETHPPHHEHRTTFGLSTDKFFLGLSVYIKICFLFLSIALLLKGTPQINKKTLAIFLPFATIRYPMTRLTISETLGTSSRSSSTRLPCGSVSLIWSICWSRTPVWERASQPVVASPSSTAKNTQGPPRQRLLHQHNSLVGCRNIHGVKKIHRVLDLWSQIPNVSRHQLLIRL